MLNQLNGVDERDKDTIVKNSIFLILILTSITLSAQTETTISTITYSYSIIDTPYGDYFGKIVIMNEEKRKTCKLIVDDGMKYEIKIIQFDDRQLVFRAFIERTKMLFCCKLVGDSIKGNVKIKGDNFNYILKGIRIER